MIPSPKLLTWLGCFYCLTSPILAQEPIHISGIYPHLAMFNEENECGTGAVVPWAGRLWVVTYAPHQPKGSTDKLYEITADLKQIVRPESIGGTPANRMIHRESKQLFIGPYAINETGKVRVIDYAQMFGRPTGNARHLFDPASKIYYATMEEGLYEVDVHSLAVKELWADEQLKAGRHANLPGYHGKGLYSSQGQLIYANNGEHGQAAMKHPETESGVLASWDGQAEKWSVVRRNQFTEVTGPAGIYADQAGSVNDQVWSIGWDHRSLILMCLHQGKWSAYRLPKASHSYDGAHGWNTEWPRIRDIGERDLLMTMHGMFWRFPRNFTPEHSAGIAPRSSYLKVVGDFCRWQDRVVLGCDDTAKSEFLNKRKAKGEIAAPQSQSNLWFLQPEQLDQLGPVSGRGAVWLLDDVAAGSTSEPFLFSGFERKSLQLAHQSTQPIALEIELDHAGNNQWQRWMTVSLAAGESKWLDLSDAPRATWIRVKCSQAARGLTAAFGYSNSDQRTSDATSATQGLAAWHATSTDQSAFSGGIVRARAGNKRTLHFLAESLSPAGKSQIGLYELDQTLTLRPDNDAAALAYQQQHAAIPTGIITEDQASLIYIDDSDRRWRLPRASREHAGLASRLWHRVCREVATERDLFHAGGTFYELPAENAGGFAKVRAVATHGRHIVDYCSYRGLLVMSGVVDDLTNNQNPHIRRSTDQRTALWVGTIDDVWQFGKPHGVGGPLLDTPMQADRASDPYLLSGFDRKRGIVSHDSNEAVQIQLEGDITGSGLWLPLLSLQVPPQQSSTFEIPAAYSAYWLRVRVDKNCRATCQLTYE